MEPSGRMEPSTSRADFAVLARRSGVSLCDEDVAILHEGYGLIEALLADAHPPAEVTAEPALVFTPQRGS